MTEAELGWTAGIVDGEGCIGIYARSGRKDFELVVCVVSTTLPMVDRLKKLWGGSIHVQQPTGSHAGKKEIHRWVLGPSAAKGFLEDIRSYLVVKGDQAGVAIEFQDTMQRSTRKVPHDVIQRREELCQKLKELKG